MRHYLLALTLVFPLAVAAQSPTWAFTDGPGFITPSRVPSSIVHNDPEVITDDAGRALVRVFQAGGTVALDGEWDPYSESLNIAAVTGDGYLVGVENLFSSGSGQVPIHDYSYSVSVSTNSGQIAWSTGEFEGGLWAEHVAVSPEGDVWVGLQGYEGFGNNESVPEGTPVGTVVASVSAADIESGAEGWTTFMPSGGEILYDLVWTSAGMLVGTDDGLYAEDAGTWTRLAFEGEAVFSVVETSTGALLASVIGVDSENGRIYQSVDGGATWTEVASLPATSVDLLATDDAVLGTARGAGVFRSVDDGATWTPTDMTVSAFSLAGQPSGPYYAAGYSATLHRSDDGLTWTPVNFVDDDPIALTGTPDGMVGRTRSTLYRFEEGTWLPILSPPSRFMTTFSSGPDGTYYTSIVYGQQFEEPGDYLSRIYRSNDAGGSWSLVGQIVGTYNALLATDAGTLFAAVPRLGAVLRSSENGSGPWTTVLSELGVNSMRQAASGTLRVVSANEYWTSTDDGLTWTEYAFSLGELRDILELEDGSLVAVRTSGIYLAAGDGEPWVPSSYTSTVRGITRNAAGDLFIGSSGCDDDAGSPLCWSTDGGETWPAFSTTAPFSSVRSLAVDEEGILFVDAPNPELGKAGTYRTLETTVDAEGDAPALLALAAYPNPAARIAQLRFSTAQAGRVTVTVYDALGRVVQTLRDADLAAGSYDVPWDASGVASGAYFVRIVTPSEARTLPITVVR